MSDEEQKPKTAEEIVAEPIKDPFWANYAAETEKKKQEVERLKAFVPPPQQRIPSAMKTIDVFERWAEDYGNLVRMVKEAGKAKISARAKGIAPKTLAARLRDIRSAIAELAYTSPHIPADADAVMKEKVFRELGEWVFVEDKRKGSSAAAVIEDPTGPQFYPMVVNSLEDAKAYLTTFDAKDENGVHIFRKIVFAIFDPALHAQVCALAAPKAGLDTTEVYIELTRRGV